MNWHNRRDAFRAILEGDECVYPAAVYDPISARIAEDLGYRAGMLPGSLASMTVLGAPDMILMTLSELSAQVYRIARASALPLMVDADHGYGNALNVRRTIEELEVAGAAALTIEDTILPAAFGSNGKRGFISLEEAAGKMRAAVDARSDSRLAIVARTSTPVYTGMADAVARVKAYADAGVDALFLARADTKEQVDEIVDAISIPIIFGAVNESLKDPEYLKSRRVCLWPHDHAPFEAAVQAVFTALKAIKDGVSPREIPGASSELLKQITRDADYRRWSRDYLS